MRILCGTVLAAEMLAANVAVGAGKACDKWDIFTDVGLFEGAVR